MIVMSGLAQWVLQWSDLLSFTTALALTDEAPSAALAAHRTTLT
jgi:hypothetical protein